MKIAVFLPNWIGDAVMATPALRALRHHFPDAHIIGILKPYIAGVVEGSPCINELVFMDGRPAPLSQRWPVVAWRLRQERPDLAVLFTNTFRSALVAWLGGCRRRVGYIRYGRGPLLSDGLYPLRNDRGVLKPSPIIDAYNQLVERVGCPWPTHRMELFTTQADEQAADQVWHHAGFSGADEVIGLNPGAAFGASKHWPIDYFIKLAQELIDRRKSRILVLCGPSERGMARQIAIGVNRPAIHTLAEHPLSIGLTKACVRRASLLITTDSGPRHFAAAFDRPVVTLFGPTHIAWTETYYHRAVHLQKPVECGPCQLRVCPLDHRCMKLLTPAEVFAAAQELLERSRRDAA